MDTQKSTDLSEQWTWREAWVSVGEQSGNPPLLGEADVGGSIRSSPLAKHYPEGNTHHAAHSPVLFFVFSSRVFVPKPAGHGPTLSSLCSGDEASRGEVELPPQRAVGRGRAGTPWPRPLQPSRPRVRATWGKLQLLSLGEAARKSA